MLTIFAGRYEVHKIDKQQLHTVIRFVSISAKFGICNVVCLKGTLAKLKYAHSCVPSGHFRFTMGQMINLAPVETKLITVQGILKTRLIRQES